MLFTDIVGSTEKAAELGDRRWRELLERPSRDRSADILARYRGVERSTRLVTASWQRSTAGARDPLCDRRRRSASETSGIEIRAGLHTGECEMVDDKVRGIAVHIGARVAAHSQARPKCSISQTVKDLVAGSGLSFEDAGEHELKGVPERWHLYRVVG